MTHYTILIYLIIALVGNAAFFFGCEGEYEACTIVSTTFFNIAVLCQILPLFTNRKEHEKNQRNGQILLCSIYLLFVSILSAYSVIVNVSYVTAGTIQIIILGIFLTMFLTMARTNLKTTKAIAEANTSRSSSLQKAKTNIREAIPICRSASEMTILREACTELDSMPMGYNAALVGLDADILSKVMALCNNPEIATQKELSQLIQKRKSMAMLALR